MVAARATVTRRIVKIVDQCRRCSFISYFERQNRTAGAATADRRRKECRRKNGGLALRRRFAAPMLISRMHSTSQSLLIGNAQQKCAESFAFFHAERGKQRILVLPCYLSDPLQCLRTRMCQVQRIQPPIFRMRPPLDQAPLLQSIQQRDKPAGMNPEAAGKLLLAYSGCQAQQSKYPRVRRRQFDNFQSFSELRGGMRAELSQEERRLAGPHVIVIHLENNYCILKSFMR